MRRLYMFSLAIGVASTLGCSLLVDWSTFADGAVDAPRDAGDGAISSQTDANAAPDANGPSSVSRYRAAVIEDGPLLYLRLGESRGATAKDEIGTTNGTYSSAGLTYGAPGALAGDPDTAMTFKDGSGRIDLPFSAEFDGLNPFSVEVWVRAAPANTTLGFVVDHEIHGSARRGWALRVGEDISLERWASESTSRSIGNISPAAGSWHHVVGVFTGTRQSLYLDGALFVEDGDNLAIPDVGTPYSIGHQSCDCNAENSFVGDLDELAIYAKPLTAERISAHYAAAK